MDWPSILPWARTVDLSQKILYPTNFFFVARKTEDRVLQVVAPKLGADTEQELPIDNNTEVRVVNAIGRPMAEKPALNSDERVEVKVTREVNPLFWAFLAFLAAIALLVPLALRSSHRRRDVVSDDDDWEEIELREAGLSRVASRSSGGEPSKNANVVSGVSRPTSRAINGAHAAFSSGDLPTPIPSNVQSLIEEIAQLDEAWEQGQVEEADYRQRRAAWKQQIAASLSQL